MSENGQNGGNAGDDQRQPIFLLPGVVTALIGIITAVHIAATLVLNQGGQGELIYWFAFLPAQIMAMTQQLDLGLPLIWTPFTHALLHAGWEHLIFNMAWLAIFGTPVARRYGAVPMLAIFFLTSAAGAALFAVTDWNSGTYLVGASGGIAGLTGAGVRFMFQPIIVARHPETGEPVALGRKLASLGEVMREPRARTFSLFWIILNAAVPLYPLFTGEAVQIAWQAHLGGFIAGFVLVGLFERAAIAGQ
ncbi:rhomboid family intramembrane serine protease [Devosia rhodophyticola]|uniref:Rhomboid family intramembrane serine protease n=1 Tax=Devosia rhodophyticola TaxID=3026423 RepID=A0ABY7YW15_9HYPH|nr:rhomboid family intramembrane serine protease [Devosia rhodophyticola]WDR05501.1 rhomboid family intramembrane serine protease [Devosia rhodophyticola]